MLCKHCGTVYQTDALAPCPNCYSLKSEMLRWVGYALGAALAVAVIGFTAGYIIEGLAPVAAQRACGENAAFQLLDDTTIQCLTKRGKLTQKVAL